jgi:hypothetical protein
MQKRKRFVAIGLAALGALVATALIVGPTLANVAAPAPPTCSAADTRRHAILTVKDPSTHEPLYIRYCGRARAVVQFEGKSYPIKGGFCLRGYRAHGERTLQGVAIGLLANPPARPGRDVSFWWLPAAIRAGPIAIDDSEIEVPGNRIAASGIVIVGPRLAGGRFTLDGRTAAGPTGKHVTGSWTCG